MYPTSVFIRRLFRSSRVISFSEMSCTNRCLHSYCSTPSKMSCITSGTNIPLQMSVYLHQVEVGTGQKWSTGEPTSPTLPCSHPHSLTCGLQPCTNLSCSRQDLKLMPYSLEASVFSSSSNKLQWCWCLSNVRKSNSLSENCTKLTFAW